MAEAPRPACPPWCAGHDRPGTISAHKSAHSFIELSAPQRSRAAAFAYQGFAAPGETVVFVMTHDAGVTAPRRFEAIELATLIDELATATPAQHRKLAGQIRAAADVAFGPGEEEVLGGWL